MSLKEQKMKYLVLYGYVQNCLKEQNIVDILFRKIGQEV